MTLWSSGWTLMLVTGLMKRMIGMLLSTEAGLAQTLARIRTRMILMVFLLIVLHVDSDQDLAHLSDAVADPSLLLYTLLAVADPSLLPFTDQRLQAVRNLWMALVQEESRRTALSASSHFLYSSGGTHAGGASEWFALSAVTARLHSPMQQPDPRRLRGCALSAVLPSIPSCQVMQVKWLQLGVPSLTRGWLTPSSQQMDSPMNERPLRSGSRHLEYHQ